MNESIMKTDRLGRLRYAPEQKKAIVEAYLTSGLSAPRFAALHGVNYQTRKPSKKIHQQEKLLFKQMKTR